MFFQLVILCFLCAIWRFWFKKPSTLEPPELSGGLPIVGHAYLGLGDSVELYKTIKKYSQEGLRKGGVVTFKVGPLTFYEKSWKNQRILLTPAFNQQVLDGFIEIFNTQAKSLVDQFRTELGKPFDHEILLRINNLETICSTLAGIDVSEYNYLRKEYVPRYQNVFKRFCHRIVRVWLYSDFIYNMTQEKKKQDEDMKYILEFSKSIIQRKRSEKANNTKSVKTTGRKFKAFMDHILDLASETGCFTDEEIREETDNIIVGGHDTTAILLTFALAVLGSNIEMQEKAYKEIFDVLGNTEEHIHKEDLMKLEYTEAIIKETLRLYPVTPILARWINKDVKLKNFTLKANTNCIISIYGLHRHKIWGPDADQFRPERWLDKETLPDLKYFGAFGLGRRACIGKVYAMMSMKITLAHLLRKYRITSDISKMVEKIEIMAKPASGHFITLALRNT